MLKACLGPLIKQRGCGAVIKHPFIRRQLPPFYFLSLPLECLAGDLEDREPVNIVAGPHSFEQVNVSCQSDIQPYNRLLMSQKYLHQNEMGLRFFTCSSIVHVSGISPLFLKNYFILKKILTRYKYKCWGVGGGSNTILKIISALSPIFHSLSAS